MLELKKNTNTLGTPPFTGGSMPIFVKCINAASFANDKQTNIDQGIILDCKAVSEI